MINLNFLKKTTWLSVFIILGQILSSHPLNAQGVVFLNGSFENNTAPAICNYNLTNSTFNSYMAFTNAYGGGNEVDISQATCYIPTIPDGLWAISLANANLDEVALSLANPLLAGNTYSFNFKAYGNVTFSALGDLEIGVSNSNNSFGTLIYTASILPSTWVQYNVSFVAPFNANYITVRNVNNGIVHWNWVDDFKSDSCSSSLNLGNDTSLCSGQSLILNAANPGATYLWQNNSTGSTFNVTQAGTYWVTVNSNGCIGTDTITINYTPTPVVNLGNDTTICQGQNVLLNATNAGASYLWQNNSVAPTFNVNQTGTYWVTVNNNNCIATDTIQVTMASVNVNLGNNTTLCQGQNLLLNAAIPGASYVWQNNSTSPTFNVTQAGTYWVQVTNNGCIGSDTITVNYNPLPVVNLGNDTTLCQGQTLTLNASIPGASYVWQNNSTASTINVNQAGTYWVQVTSNNCVASDTIVVNVASTSINLGNDTILCQGQNLLLNATVLGATYLWQNNSTMPTFNVTQAGTYWVQVSANGCTGKDTINVNYSPIPLVNLGNDSTICQGQNLILNASVNGASYLWQNNSTNAIFNVTQTGTYWVNVTVNGCSKRDTVVVNVTPLPVVDLGNDTLVCQGDQLLLDVTLTGASYQWHDQSTLSTFNVTQSGQYWVKVTLNGCSSSDSIQVTYVEPPYVNLGVDITLCDGDQWLLDAGFPGATYFWQDNSTTSTFLVQSEGTYWVNVSKNNCVASDTITITTENCGLFIPTVFSPNNDGLNDIFRIIASSKINLDVFTIYNRWGQRVFEYDKQLLGWDGKFKNVDCDMGTYYYYIKYRINGKPDILWKKGNVELVR